VANIGLIEFEAKMQFTLMVIPMDAVIDIVQDQLGGKLTSVTLEAWKTMG